MNNKLIKIQEMLMKEMERLSDKDVNGEEISRSNALSNSAMTYIKTINLGLRIKETAIKNQMTEKTLKDELGLNEKEI